MNLPKKKLIIRGKLFKINFLHRKWNAEQDQQFGTNSTIQEYLERGEVGNRCMYLDRGEVAVDELGDRLLPGRELLADLTVLEAAADLGPVLRVLDPPLKPGGVVPEAVLLVPPAGDDPPGAAVGDDEGEYGEGEEEQDEEEEPEEA